MSINIRKESGAPTENTIGFIGEIYEDTNTGTRYECTGMYKVSGSNGNDPDCDYVWDKIDMIEEKRIPGGSGGSGVEQIVFSVDYDNEFQVTLIDKTYEDAKRLIDNKLPFVTSAVLYNDGTARVHRCDMVFLIDDEKYFKFEFTGWASFSVKLYEDDRLEYEAGGNG